MGERRTEKIHLCGLKPNAVFSIRTLDREYSAAWLWRQMGCLINLTRKQEEALKELEPVTEYLKADENGH